VNVAALSAKQPSTHLMASNAAKAALLGFAKRLANEVGTYNILVNAVCPGRIRTPQIEGLFAEEERENIARTQIPLGRFGVPQEGVNLVVFLASESASYIHGSVIQVDGGLCRGLC
jgi:3-oxoacyl-[acyl-carrier protein] reductase